MNVKAVVFDLDGTIVSFNLDYKSARADVIQFFTSQGFPQSIFSMNESVFEMLKKAEIYLQNHRVGAKDLSKLKKDVWSIMEKYEMESAKSTQLLPGIIETLQALKKMRLKLGLFTVNSQRATEHILSTFRLKPFFRTVVTRDSVDFVKPNPIHLETVLKALKVKPEETIVIGDSVLDMKAAQGLDVFAVGTSTGFATPEQLTRAGANCLISSPLDIIPLVEKLDQTESATD
ncbi:MAG TPA: HAD family hydrolase [Candidatus Bathyarchaeia archaeon]|nr:HAD family hydrolase [Candidatus Bathyarchaeia archaeon]